MEEQWRSSDAFLQHFQGGDPLEVQAATLLPKGAKSMLEEWMALDVGKLTRAALEAL